MVLLGSSKVNRVHNHKRSNNEFHSIMVKHLAIQCIRERLRVNQMQLSMATDRVQVCKCRVSRLMVMVIRSWIRLIIIDTCLANPLVII